MSSTDTLETKPLAPDHPPAAGCAHLLVVDDEESVAYTVSEVLRLDGYRVDTVLRGEDAIKRLEAESYDLVLTDLHMEGADGISVLTELRRCSPLTIAIVLTGFASLESAIAAMRQGAYDYLIKPCIIDDMKHTIQRALQHSRLMKAEEEARASLEMLNRDLERRVEERTAELRRVNEELASANSAKDFFFATLSHELRTPLTPILGWSRLLRSSAQSPHLLLQGLDAIERNARLQTRLIDDLLDVSRIVSGKLHIDIEPTDICAVVAAAVETVREKAAQQGVELDVPAASAPIMVQGSPVRLQQIVWNLLSNAIKFSEKGDRVRVEVARSDREARVQVTDDGVGIGAEFLPYVFAPFRQGDGSITRKHQGLGLGLAIVRKLIELHGGWVRAESDGPGRGSRFTFAIPCATAAPAKTAVSGAALPVKIPQPVLIVEDAADTLEMLVAFFKMHDCQVLAADSAAVALKLAAEATPGLIVSDIALPSADGYDLIGRLRQTEGLERVPAVALTGYATDEDSLRARQAGFSAHVAKPVDFEKLLAVIQDLIS